MDAQAIRDKFRHQFTNLHALTVFTVSLFEIIGYIILIMSEVEYFSLQNLYLWYGVILPIVVNTITFSAGIAPYNRGITAEDLFEQADKTLYAAKRAGKNRVLIQ